MHLDILGSRQVALLDIISKFRRDFVLVGGTSIALQIGHRESIDFDLFSECPIRQHDILRTILDSGYDIERTLVDNGDELTVIVGGVKLTFLEFPFRFIHDTVAILP